MRPFRQFFRSVIFVTALALAAGAAENANKPAAGGTSQPPQPGAPGAPPGGSGGMDVGNGPPPPSPAPSFQVTTDKIDLTLMSGQSDGVTIYIKNTGKTRLEKLSLAGE